MQRSLWMTVVFSLGLGCGGDGGGGGGIALEDLGERLATASCAKIFECCDDAEIMEIFMGFNPPITTEEQCREFYIGIAEGLLLPQTQASIEAGRLEYHGDVAADCVAKTEAAACGEGDPGEFLGGPGCGDPFEGLVANGEACDHDDECVSNYCEEQFDDMGMPIGGTCGTLPGMGDACTFECAEGLFCEFGPMGMPTCQPLLSNGSECDFDDQCESDSCEGGDPMMGVPGMCGESMMCDGA